MKVHISSLDISLTDKKASVNGLRISNPHSYKKPHAMTADKIIIGLNTASKQLIDFNDIKVEGSVINLEVTEKSNNLTDLKNLAAQKAQKKSIGSEQVKVIVRNMVIGTSTLNPSITLLGADVDPIKIPSVRLSNVGKRQNGVVAKDAIHQIVTKYIKTAENEANSAGLLANAVTEVVTDTITGTVEGTTKVIEGTAEGIEDAAGSIAKGLGELF